MGKCPGKYTKCGDGSINCESIPCGYYWCMSAVSGKCVGVMHPHNQFVDSLVLSLNLILFCTFQSSEKWMCIMCSHNHLVVCVRLGPICPNNGYIIVHKILLTERNTTMAQLQVNIPELYNFFVQWLKNVLCNLNMDNVPVWSQ